MNWFLLFKVSQSFWSRCLQPAVDRVRDVFGLKIPPFNWCWQKWAEQRGWVLLWPSCWLSDRASFVLRQQPSITHTHRPVTPHKCPCWDKRRKSPLKQTARRGTLLLLCDLQPSTSCSWSLNGLNWGSVCVCVFKVGHSSEYTWMKYFLPSVRGGWCIQGFEAFKVKLAHLCWDLASGFVENSFSRVCICKWV